jgi:hypothetical protein
MGVPEDPREDKDRDTNDYTLHQDLIDDVGDEELQSPEVSLL